MQVVVIYGWNEASPELIQALATALGILPYEARQRLIGGGPAVIASFADGQQAHALATRLRQGGFSSRVVDSAGPASQPEPLRVRRFELGPESLILENPEGQRAALAYGEIQVLLAATGIGGQLETSTVTERKFSIGKTLLAGGLPMTSKVSHTEVSMTETREELLYLYAGQRPPLVLRRAALNYDGLGAAMQLSRELNFAHLKTELRRLCPGARYDDRLLQRAPQVRLLGPALNPESHLELACTILAHSLGAGGQETTHTP